MVIQKYKDWKILSHFKIECAVKSVTSRETRITSTQIVFLLSHMKRHTNWRDQMIAETIHVSGNQVYVVSTLYGLVREEMSFDRVHDLW
jgi:hypothetical protein